mgnify:CR=1 FL=1
MISSRYANWTKILVPGSGCYWTEMLTELSQQPGGVQLRQVIGPAT